MLQPVGGICATGDTWHGHRRDAAFRHGVTLIVLDAVFGKQSLGNESKIGGLIDDRFGLPQQLIRQDNRSRLQSFRQMYRPLGGEQTIGYGGRRDNQMRRIAERLPAAEKRPAMVAVGGGARSALWLQILADVLGVPLSVPRVVEAGSLGAAIVAGVGVGVWRSTREAAADAVEIVDRVEPDAARRAAYDRLYGFFCELEARVAPLYRYGAR